MFGNNSEKYGLIVLGKTMAFRVKHAARKKTVLRTCVLEQVNRFNYQGCIISYQYDNNINIYN